jgi:hypothetical protein
MSALSSILRLASDSRINWWCPGCHDWHGIQFGEGAGPRWTWNGDVDKPTFQPSILVRYPANPKAEEEFKEWRQERVCHSFVVDGKMQFLGDCTHELAGLTVDIPPFPGRHDGD